MGIATNTSGRHRSRLEVTPLVDVVLVLLIIFLVTTPFSLRYLQTSQVDAEPGFGTEPVRVTFYADGAVKIRDGAQEIRTYRIHLASELRPILETNRANKNVIVDIDTGVLYGDAISVVDTIKGVGATDISLAMGGPAGE